MKYNLKNRPPNHDDYDKDWFEGFEKELRKILRSNKPYGPSPMQKELIKEILGESEKEA